MDKDRIRPISICLFRNGNRILVSEGFDSIKRGYFYRPLGGGIEFGESSQAAISREIKEELGAEVENLRLVGVLENIFVYEGQRGHEIVFVYDAEFADKELYRLDELDGYEQEAQVKFRARWMTSDEIRMNNGRLVPEGLEKLFLR